MTEDEVKTLDKTTEELSKLFSTNVKHATQSGCAAVFLGIPAVAGFFNVLASPTPLSLISEGALVIATTGLVSVLIPCVVDCVKIAPELATLKLLKKGLLKESSGPQ